MNRFRDPRRRTRWAARGKRDGAVGKPTAGEFVQKLGNYRIHLVIVGDLDAQTVVSEPLRAFVAESNRGRHLWFVPDRLSLQDRIATIQ